MGRTPSAYTHPKKHPKTMSKQPPPPKPHDTPQTKAGGGVYDANCTASLIVHDPSDLPKCDGEILVALWGVNEWEIVNVRENVGGPFTAEYKSTGELADPSEWQWWADLHCMVLHNA